MYVEVFSICDAAADYSGRLNLLGAFEGIVAQTAPIVRDRCTIAVRIRFGAEETGRHAIEVKFVDADGKQVGPNMSAHLAVKTVAGRASGAHNLVMNINRLQFPDFGSYEIQLFVDGAKARVLPLLVAQAQRRNRMRNPMEN